MVVDCFAEASDARNDEGSPSVHQRDEDRANAGVRDDDPCVVDVLDQVAEGKVGDARRSSRPDLRRTVLDNQKLVASDGGHLPEQTIEWNAVRSGRDEDHVCPSTLPA
jgi:hypothetical protein